jgi:23S rRNA pseudouridine955/2504/2580 synthase
MASSSEGRELIAGPDDAGRRLDRVLRSILGELPLSAIYGAMRRGRIKVNGGKASPELRLSEGDRIFLAPPLGPLARGSAAGTGEPNVEGLDSISDILVLATRDLLFINKPRGLLAQGDEEIEGRIRRALAGRSAGSLSFSPGPLHRLDRNTTGLMTFPRSAAGAREFSELLRRRALEKEYLALVDGEAEATQEWRDRIARDGDSLRSSVVADGEEASASMRPLASAGGRSLVLVELHTGLTHQIRVQASSRGMPLSGDSKYGGSPLGGGYILHAFSLGFPEPPFPDLPRRVIAPLPERSRERLAALFGDSVLKGAIEGIDKG